MPSLHIVDLFTKYLKLGGAFNIENQNDVSGAFQKPLFKFTSDMNIIVHTKSCGIFMW